MNTPARPLNTPQARRSNLRVAFVAGSVAIGMVGMAYASVPLYRLFCQITGFGGTTQVAEGPSSAILDRDINVAFDANVNRGLDWNFVPVQRKITLKIGEQKMAYYRATNTSNRTITGTAVFNVTPQLAGKYFNKVACFCFTEQTLKPGESVEMPVSFFVDPEVVNDKNLKQITTITLSYTFYEADIGQTETTDVSTNTAPASGETSQKPVVN
ncbi:Cytochrome oxidase biogenesis protein Cox11-CtaG, copper delivery to Cox1 [hydrothermal vent metagenome]|uniref:Cytochrome oxidase biogenesis protein Cox11-CtaG, copper delivery to Cox1 n=1 Tax=hydrothermal vent metagenome TaxID=652676 RepID=A0A3B0T6X3_9ZZZZ